MEGIELLKVLEVKYNIKILGANSETIIYNKNGYIHKIQRANVSRVNLENPQTMIESSYIKWLNNTLFSNTPLEVFCVKDDMLTIINNNSLCLTNVYKYNINIESILNITTKHNKYREKIIQILGDKYDYSKCWPIDTRSVVTIICPEHGEFKATVTNLIHRKSGCPICANKIKGFSKSNFRKSCEKNNNGLGCLYFIKLYNEKESFIKVGITSKRDRNERYKHYINCGYCLQEINFIYAPSDLIYDTEKNIHKNLGLKNYLPEKEFNGKFECFNDNQINKINKIICENLKNYI